MAVQQEIRFATTRTTGDGLPVFETGEEVRGTVQMVTDTDARCRGVQLWIGCRIHGSGTSETIDLLPEQFIHEGDLQAGLPVTAEFAVQIPLDGPLSYQGRRVKFDWEVRLRVDIPIWPDQRHSFPFHVAPRRRVEEAEE